MRIMIKGGVWKNTEVCFCGSSEPYPPYNHIFVGFVGNWDC